MTTPRAFDRGEEGPDLLPEQRRALDYVRAKGSDAPVAEVRRRVAEAFTEIDELLASVPTAQTGRRPDAVSWSTHEVVDHLVESHRPAVRQLESLLAGTSPAKAIPAGLLSQEPFRRDWQAAVAELRRVNGDLLALLAGAGDETPTTARAPVEMVVRCATPDGGSEPVHWIDRFDWKAFALLLALHTREHAVQVRRILARLA